MMLDDSVRTPYPVPANEPERIAELRALEILDTPSTRSFDDLAALAARMCETPIALVTLVDDQRQWFKAHIGIDLTETSRAHAFCNHAIMGPEVLIVPDAGADPRFAQNPLVVGPPYVRFYAGAPLVTPAGHALGTLCVIDRRPREMTEDQRVTLEMLAEQVVDQILRLKSTADLQRALAQAQKAKNRLYRAFESSLVGIVSFRLSGEVLDANHAFLKMVGYQREELLRGALDPLDITAPAWREETQKAVERLGCSGELRAREKEYLRADGTRVPVLVSATKLDDSDECIAFIVDLSQQKETESNLRKSEYRLRGLFDAAPIGAVFTGLDGRFERANPAFCKIVGYTEQALIGRLFSELVHPDDRAADPPLVAALLNGEIDTYRREKRYVHRDGHAIWVLLLASVIRDERGEAIGFAGQAQEIGERRRAEDELRLSETRLRAIMESAYDSILWTDTNATIRYANPACEQMFGYAPGEMMGLDSNVLLPEEYRELNRQELARFRETGQPLSLVGSRVEVTSRRKDGTLIPVEMSLTTWTMEGETFFAGIARDISERKRIEAELIQAKSVAEEAATAKSAFLARMSHEIRTPMNGVSGMIDLALRTPLTGVQRDYLETARSSAASLLGVINDILDFSKIEAGKLTLGQDAFSLQECLEGAVRGLAPLSNAKGLEVMLLPPALVPDGLIGDRWRLRQVVTNLLSNAIKFTDRGEILLSVHALERTEAGVTLEFRIADTGIGIPASDHAAIFETFRQAEETTTRRFGGTGLGLAICTQLVQLMDGAIGVNSAPGKGSTFHFSARFGLAPEAALPPAPPDLGGVSVLVVIANDRLRSLVAGMLSGWHMRPRAVATREAALDATRESDAGFQIVLLDEPVDPTGTLEQELRALSSDDLRVIRTTAGPPITSRADEPAGMRTWFSKPITAANLLETIRGLLAGGDALGAGSSVVRRTPSGLPPLRILLAEDNPVNERVATILLESDGHSVFPVTNGRLALAAYSTQPFDVVLMDVQMPEVDGLEATRTIRAQEHAGQRIPIVALTAQALRGDREICLDAGADAYLTKPFNADELFLILRKVVRGRPRETAPPSAVIPILPAVEPQPAVASQSFHIKTLLDALGGDQEAGREVVTAFFLNLPSMQKELEMSLLGDDPRAVRAAAHKLKGTLLTLGARKGAELAARLESVSGTGAIETARRESRALTIELERFVAELFRWLGKRPTPTIVH